MADPRFFRRSGPFSLGELADISGARIADAGAASFVARDIAPLDRAGPDEIAFFDNPRYRDALGRTAAGAVVLAAAHAGHAPPGVRLLLAARPHLAFARIAQAFYPETPPDPAVHPAAIVAPDASVDATASIAAGAVVMAGARIGARTSVAANAVIGPGVSVAEDCRIGPGASLRFCLVEARTRIHAGARIGEDGFGFAPDAAGHVKMPQVGRVLIGADCEIGANSTIDRGSLADTVVGDGVWIDNLVQIGHNVRIGRGAVIVAQAGVAGSSEIGELAQLGAQAGIAGHLSVGAGARIGAQSGVMQSVPAGETWFGYPAQPIRRELRQIALLRRQSRRKDEER